MSSCGTGCACKGEEKVQSQSVTGQSAVDDDVWGENEPLNNNAYLERTHQKQGYLDGLMHSQESKLQEGFDMGYPKGAQLGIATGEILGRLMAENNTDRFLEGKKELNITNVLNKPYFDEDLEIKGEHDLLNKWHGIVGTYN